MKKYIFSIALAIGALTFTSCEQEESLTPNSDFQVGATGENPNPKGTDGDISGGDDGNNGGGPATDLVVLNRQRATVTYVGATWCPPCGAYGDPTKVHMESTHGSDVTIINVQSGDAISSSSAFGPKFGSAFQSFVGSTSIPHAYWSGANFTMADRGFTASASTNNNNADRDINAIVSDNADVGIAAKASLSNGSVDVETLVKFYTASSDSYIGVYLLEDGVEASQSISGSSAMVTSHENVLRGSAVSGNNLGVESFGVAFTEDEEVLKNYSISVPSTVVDTTKLQVAVIVWESNQANGISNSILVDVK